MAFSAPAYERSSPISDIPLLAYQRVYEALKKKNQIIVWLKSRRIGASWADAGLATLNIAAAGTGHHYYQAYNKDMTRQYISDAKNWAKKFQIAMGDIQINDADKDNLTFEVRCASGRRIEALSANPAAFRSKGAPGDSFTVDECRDIAGFIDILEAITPVIIWGSHISFMSSAARVTHPFTEVIADIQSGKRKGWALLKTTFLDAMKDGLYRRICQINKKNWAVKEEEGFYYRVIGEVENPAQELFCIPGESSGAWMTTALIEARTDAALPLLRWATPDGVSPTEFTFWPERAREAEINQFFVSVVMPALVSVGREQRGFLGWDFGRSGDKSSIAVMFLMPTMLRRAIIIELAGCPFRQQEQLGNLMIEWLVDNGGFGSAQCDARGIGNPTSEALQQKWGENAIVANQTSARWYDNNMPPLKQAFEDGAIAIPRQVDIINDLRSVEVINGTPKPPDGRIKGTDGIQRHCDSAVALALAYAATRNDAGALEWEEVIPHDPFREQIIAYGKGDV
ncbi:hypothetical protein NQX30_05575 [Candidatus Persebacteraceae bacterium Df01]|jgi:phage FluMu gp28-like protein|uniref:Mu-like prophage FluMu protein gp28 n=1 Tax=Candidatus Doriopsillibacter californiensis TaxID=2970740 RepID=A0ABT7QMB1_9GAMM|nr:hypothetical protein [Candidatus Persebacteraceae bacterium Df01]